jgi:hypothetical protein
LGTKSLRKNLGGLKIKLEIFIGTRNIFIFFPLFSKGERFQFHSLISS